MNRAALQPRIHLVSTANYYDAEEKLASIGELLADEADFAEEFDEIGDDDYVTLRETPYSVLKREFDEDIAADL